MIASSTVARDRESGGVRVRRMRLSASIHARISRGALKGDTGGSMMMASSIMLSERKVLWIAARGGQKFGARAVLGLGTKRGQRGVPTLRAGVETLASTFFSSKLPFCARDPYLSIATYPDFPL